MKRLTKRSTGILLVVSAAALAVLFWRLMDVPSMAIRPDGTRGEMFGPISVLRGYVYGIFAVQALIGLVILMIHRHT